VPEKLVVESVYMFPIKLIASIGYPISSIIVSSLAWSIEPNAFLKSMYKMYMSCLVYFASSKGAMISCICLIVHLSSLKPS
jgi:hypothetical protein